MINNTDAAAKLCSSSDFDTTGNAGKSGHQRVFANIHIVGDMTEIIELDPAAQAGVAEHAAVNGAIGTNAHIITHDNAPEMRELHQPVRAGHEAKPCLAQNTPWTNAAIPANQSKADYRARTDLCAFAYFDAGSDDRVGADLAVFSNPRARADRCAGRNDSAGSDTGGWINGGVRHARVRHHQLRGNTRKSRFGMGMRDEGRTVAQFYLIAKCSRPDNDAFMLVRHIGFFVSADKYQRTRRGSGAGCNILDATRGISGELTIELAGNFPCVQ